MQDNKEISKENKVEQEQNGEEPGRLSPEQIAQQASEDARIFAMLCHLFGIFTSFLAPLVIWLLKKNDEPFVDQQGKEALNFQLTILIASSLCALLSLICIGILLAFAVAIADFVLGLIATIKSRDGQAYRYPVSIRFVR